MNSKISSFLNNRGVLVVLSIIVLIVFGLIISIMVNTGNFDNEDVQGTYTGNLSFQDRAPMQLNITFDGESDASGLLSIEGVSNSFNSEYVVEGLDITFSILLEDINLRFIGSLQANATILSGEVQIIDANSEEVGTFFLSVISS